LAFGKRHFFGLLGLVGALSAASCGGGGGGGTGSGTGGGTAADPVAGLDTPTFQFSARYRETRWAELADEALQTGGRLLNYAQFATDLVHRFAASSGAAAITANCAYSGTITMQLSDRDGNARASVGDAITAVLDNCGVPALGRAATGTVRIDIQSSVSQDVTTDFLARLVVVDGLRLTGMAGGGNPGFLTPGVLRGSIGASWSEYTAGVQLRALSTTEDDLNFTATYDGIESVDRMRRIDVSQALRYDLATSTGTAAFMYDVGTRGGALRVRTPVSLQGDLDVVPRQMRVEMDIAGNQIIRLQRGTSITGPTIEQLYGSVAGAVYGTSTAVWRGEVLRLTRDIRNPAGPDTYLDQGYGVRSIASWRETAAMSDIDLACFRPVAGVSFFKADAVFQRPVVPPRALSEADGVMRLQFGRAIAESTPTLQFRFADSAEVFDPRYPAWHVPATALRHGATYEVRPSEPLRKGRIYLLQTSTDGVAWNAPRTFVDAQGAVVSSGGAALAALGTDISFTANIAAGDTGAVSAAAPARLQVGATLLVGQTVTAYQWQQVSGAPVILSSPQRADTDVILPTGPREVDDVVLQVTLTDSRGTTDRARVVVTVGDRASAGAVKYTEIGRGAAFSRRSMTRGAGSIFYGPEAGRVLPREVGASEGGTGVSFSVTTADGARLQPGLYANAAQAAAPVALPGLISGVFCNTLGSPVSGSFEVLEVAYAADGRITRLAIDYQQRCDTGGEYERSSYRFNSAVALRP
jgi:hypothetical protein